LGEEVGFGVEAVGGEDGGVEGGVGVFEGGLAGEFEGSVEGAEAAFESAERVKTNYRVFRDNARDEYYFKEDYT